MRSVPRNCLVVLAVVLAGEYLLAGERVLPPVPREMRAIWIATVDNIDWPSRPGLSTADQQDEMLALLDMCVEMNLNAVIFQVRPVADALYESELEPWSAFLSGRQGVAPDPPYDPLAFTIRAAHSRGLEVHAWLNPFRASHPANDTVSDTHVIRTHPEWVHRYGPYHWMDPGHPEARAHSLAVVEDLLTRYDLDGLHFDDYFYPYPVDADGGGKVPFPDDATWAAYQRQGGDLSRDDWRRDNINRFVRQVYERARATSPHVRVGFSPFGIWRPGHPSQIKGFDAYTGLFADARLWLREGWLDYLVPQLYWAIDPPGQSYPVLLRWWVDENRRQRHIWAGNAAHRALSTGRGWDEHQLARQVEVTREQSGASGNVYFSAKWFLKHPDTLRARIAALYRTPALVPATPWLEAPELPAPLAFVQREAETLVVHLAAETDPAGTHWVVQSRTGEDWSLQIEPADTRKVSVPGACDLIVVRAVDRVGNLSPATILAVP